jgi:hypothetical protein
MKKVLIDETGKRYGKLLVLCRASNHGTKARWHCVCDCGQVKQVTGGHLRSGHSASCGCTAFEKMRIATTTHGMASTPLYKVWKEMRARCNRVSHARFSDYGGRGVQVCDAWNTSFEAFKKDVGLQYQAGLQLDRINNDGHYEPGNTRWVDAKTNCRNSRSVRITEQDAGIIKTLLNFGVTYQAAANILGTTKHIVASIGRCRTWKDISPLVAI